MASSRRSKLMNCRLSARSLLQGRRGTYAARLVREDSRRLDAPKGRKHREDLARRRRRGNRTDPECSSRCGLRVEGHSAERRRDGGPAQQRRRRRARLFTVADSNERRRRRELPAETLEDVLLGAHRVRHVDKVDESALLAGSESTALKQTHLVGKETRRLDRAVGCEYAVELCKRRVRVEVTDPKTARGRLARTVRIQLGRGRQVPIWRLEDRQLPSAD